MEDKVFSLLEKMYIEMQEMKSNMATKDELKEFKSSIESRIDKLENNMTRMENELKKDISTLYDGYIQNTEQISRVNDKLDQLIDKVDNQEIKLQVLRGAK